MRVAWKVVWWSACELVWNAHRDARRPSVRRDYCTCKCCVCAEVNALVWMIEWVAALRGRLSTECERDLVSVSGDPRELLTADMAGSGN